MLVHGKMAEDEECSSERSVQQPLHEMITSEWLVNRSEVSECELPYYNLCSELTVEGQLILKGHQVVVPQVIRKELLQKSHATHIGIEGCIQ